jgi:hypothetical protein
MDKTHDAHNLPVSEGKCFKTWHEKKVEQLFDLLLLIASWLARAPIRLLETQLSALSTLRQSPCISSMEDFFQ